MKGLFVGLTTLDWVYLVQQVPQANQKIVALDQTWSAGGPATNAALTFSALGNEATLVGALGSHPLTRMIGEDLQTWGVAFQDRAPELTQPPPMSSILVTQGTGERAVISRNAQGRVIDPQRFSQGELAALLSGVEIMLADGHQMLLSVALAQMARAKKIPVLLDGGSWKPGLENLLPWITHALCSGDFYPPQTQTPQQVFAYLQGRGIPYRAITRGADPILYQSPQGAGEIAVPAVPVRDTTGAGDIFHGGFCHFYGQADFITALGEAAALASRGCQFLGSRGDPALFPSRTGFNPSKK